MKRFYIFRKGQVSPTNATPRKGFAKTTQFTAALADYYNTLDDYKQLILLRNFEQLMLDGLNDDEIADKLLADYGVDNNTIYNPLPDPTDAKSMPSFMQGKAKQYSQSVAGVGISGTPAYRYRKQRTEYDVCPITQKVLTTYLV